MKRILFYVLFSLSSFFAFTQEKNIILRKTFPIQEISTINAELQFENLTITAYHGEDILVEVSSNNQKLLPEINFAEDSFQITKSSNEFNKGDNCSIFVYVPYELQISDYNVGTWYGNLNLENLTASESIKITTQNSKVAITNLDCNYFYIEGGETSFEINQLSSAYFTILLTAGSITTYLKKAPQAKSLCRIKDGPIFMSIPRTEAFEVTARSTKGSFINNFTKSEQRTPDWKTYINGNDGAEITLQSFSGDITLAP